MPFYTDDPALANLCWEEEGSPVEQYTANGLVADVTLRSKWEDAQAILDDILYKILGYPNKFILTGDTPPRTSYLTFAATGTITPVGKQDAEVPGEQTAKYEQALIKISYQPANFSVAVDPNDPTNPNADVTDMYEESLQPMGQSFTVGSESMWWDGPDSGRPVKKDFTIAQLMLSTDWVQTRYRLATIPTEATSLIGKTNSAALTATTLNLSFATETLMFNPPTMRRTIDSTGNGLWTMTTRFSYNPNGWNKFWDKENSVWESVFSKTGGYTPYPTADFSNIIAPFAFPSP